MSKVLRVLDVCPELPRADEHGTCAEKEAAPATFANDALVSGVAFALILTVVQRLAGFARNILLCKYLDQDELGQWSLVFSFVFLLAPLTVLGLPGCFGRFVEHYQLKSQLGTFLKRITGICIGTTLLFSVSMCFWAEGFSRMFFRDETNTDIIYSVAATLIAVTMVNYLTSLMEALRQVRIVTIMRFLSAIVFSVASVLLLLATKGGAAAVTWGLGIGSLLACLPAIYVLWKNRKVLRASQVPLNKVDMWWRIAPYAAWMWASNLLQNVADVLDRSMLIHYADVPADVAQAYVGQYFGARILPWMLIGVATMLGGVLMPYLTAHWERDEIQQAKTQLNYSIKLTAVGFTILGALILVFAPILFDVVLQKRYTEAFGVLPITLVYAIWFSLFIIGKDFLWVIEKGKWAVAVAAVGVVANVFLNRATIPTYGLWGAVGSTTLSYGLTLSGIFWLNGKFGASQDIRCWVAATVPLLLLTNDCLFAFVAILIIAVGMTNFILDENERMQVNATIDKSISRLV